MYKRLIFCLIGGLSLALPCLAQDQPLAPIAPNTIVIKNHQFIPPQLTVPAGKKLEITIDNQDPTAEEFESFDLDREQVVRGHKQITVYIGPLKPGKYGYWADYHQDSKGIIVAQ
ncbi:MAG: cupredoxin domain-containing protein [Candidatus Omnitrophica bacterium]|nr:cupredoxin domain-containing protein [Candidatus Omnitrophota bacterium]MDE2222412.1 cupredoxin domain-containing protein [Candidatus Omnitrophota bacterium]